MSRRLPDPELELFAQRVAELVVAQMRSAQRPKARRSSIDGKVAAFLRDHPDASANVIAREVAGRRTDVLRAVRRLRHPDSRFPARGNHPDESARAEGPELAEPVGVRAEVKGDSNS